MEWERPLLTDPSRTVSTHSNPLIGVKKIVWLACSLPDWIASWLCVMSPYSLKRLPPRQWPPCQPSSELFVLHPSSGLLSSAWFFPNHSWRLLAKLSVEYLSGSFHPKECKQVLINFQGAPAVPSHHYVGRIGYHMYGWSARQCRTILGYTKLVKHQTGILQITTLVYLWYRTS